jgi:hypothetical protein
MKIRGIISWVAVVAGGTALVSGAVVAVDTLSASAAPTYDSAACSAAETAVNDLQEKLNPTGPGSIFRDKPEGIDKLILEIELLWANHVKTTACAVPTPVFSG